MSSWDSFFLQMTNLVAQKSKDRSTKVGAVIVGPDNEVRSVGYNGFPRGVDDDVEARHQRPAKYLYTEHAERNALYNALRAGISVKGCRMYLSYTPCHDCARGVIQAGIAEIVTPDTVFPGVGAWTDSISAGLQMLAEAGVQVRKVGPGCE